MSSLVHHVRQSVRPQDYWEWVFPGLAWPPGGIEPRLKSPLRDDHNPSLTVNKDTGAWCDHGSDDNGTSIISFHAALNNITHQEAAADLFQAFLHPVIDSKTVRKWHRNLKANQSMLDYLVRQRFVSMEVIEQFQLGLHMGRISIPVKNEYGLYVNAKRYKPNGKPKIISYKIEDEPRSYGSPTMLFPVSVMMNTSDEDVVFVTEGELDTLALLSLGIMAVTGTSGAKAWPVQYNELFRNREVVIAYDNDADGTKYDQRVMRHLSSIARVIKRLKIPHIKYGKQHEKTTKDVTDWIKVDPTMRKAENWLAAAEAAEVMVENPRELVEARDVQRVALDRASSSEYYGQRIRVDALVTGKDTAPYILPKKFRVSCSKQCEGCPLAESAKPFREKVVDPRDPATLEMIDASKATIRRVMITTAGLPIKPSCRHECEVVETVNIERLLLIPSLDDKESQYVIRPSYYIGHGLPSNRTYGFEGQTVADPVDQHATHLFDQATPVQDQIETFELTPELVTKLRSFQARGKTGRHVLAKLRTIAEWQATNVTKIRSRPDLHIGVDLVFHSVRSFQFNGEVVKRGMLDVLVLGDTRCGKGYVTEGLIRYYNLGEVANGENCSFAGLVGGCESVGKRFIVKWGIIPLNNGRLVAIDEASALSEEEFGHMSRVRSEGIAEISKIVREQTQANTRLVWLSNTRSGRGIMSYNSGVQAIKELVGANEDIARFDYAITVATNEVSSDIINTVSTSDGDDKADLYPRDLCRSLVLWAWSRASKDITFTPEATTGIIEAAKRLGMKYNATIPLVQAENVRIKLAKIATAIACRVFSCDPTGQQVIVNIEHVEAAEMFITECYSKPSMGYDSYSNSANSKMTISDEGALSTAFEALGDCKIATTSGLLTLHHVTADTLADYTGDMYTAKTLLGQLVLLGCVSRWEKGNWYFKNPAFTVWLRERAK